MPKPSLLDPIVPEHKQHDYFKYVRLHPQSVCARAMLNNIFAEFIDPDGNFVEQFQTTGFDNRYFELYLFAYFSRSGYKLDRSYPVPDFIVERNGQRVAIEATTSNPSTSGVLKDAKTISEMTHEELANYQQNELAIRFGGPLLSKLRKRYWEQPQCDNIPMVLAIEAFHDTDALFMTDSALMRYVYGSQATADWSHDARLVVTTRKVDKHAARGKEIPSHFFGQPDTENISAIIFTNSGTHGKFSRMGYQHGYETDEIEIVRFGRSYTMDPDAMDPTFFSYKLSEPAVIETWGQGLIVMHNPRATLPLPEAYFVDAVQCHQVDGKIVTEHLGWHPFSSRTMIHCWHGAKKELKKILPPFPPFTQVSPLPRDIVRDTLLKTGSAYQVNEHEQGWFADAALGFYGIVLKNESDWRFEIYARDEFFTFFKLYEEDVPKIRELAVERLQFVIADYLRSPQRIFPGRKPPEPRTSEEPLGDSDENPSDIVTGDPEK